MGKESDMLLPQIKGRNAAFLLGEASEDVLQLMRVTKESLYKGIEKAVAGNRIGDISYAIQEHTERKYGYGVVRELVGHGLGRS